MPRVIALYGALGIIVVGAVAVLLARPRPLLADDPVPGRPPVRPGDALPSAEELAAVRFPVAVRGYRMADVDAYFAAASAALAAAQRSQQEPAGTEPAGTEPAGTEPAGTEPAGTEPAAMEPAVVEPASEEPHTTGPSGDANLAQGTAADEPATEAEVAIPTPATDAEPPAVGNPAESGSGDGASVEGVAEPAGGSATRPVAPKDRELPD